MAFAHCRTLCRSVAQDTRSLVVSVAPITARESGSGFVEGNSRFSAKFKVQPEKNCGRGNMGAEASNVDEYGRLSRIPVQLRISRQKEAGFETLHR
jgi:hypothetical protein